MIGSPEDAYIASTLPEEFLLSDDGTSRLVYLINDVVYKVNRHSINDNLNEYNNGEILRKAIKSMGIVVPEMSLYGEVLAMEYINGIPTGECLETVYLGLDCECEGEHLDNELIDKLSTLGWEDCTYGNAMWFHNTLYLIDVAY